MQEFDTPLEWVEFHKNSEKVSVYNVVARMTLDPSRVVVKTADGSYYAFKDWDWFQQSPGASFF